MKTLQDLVDKLNKEFHDDGCFRLSLDKYSDKYHVFYYIYRDYDGYSYELIEINRSYNTWRLGDNLSCELVDVQKVVVDFLANSNPKDWFPKKKYNIVIGIDTNTDFKTAYRKTASKGIYEVNGYTELNDLRKNQYIFTEEEIKNLKVTLPPDLSKIVDLGKVEVTN